MPGGELAQWHDDRGFGFIAGDDGERYFVHITEIDRINTRPRQGDRVTFTPARGKDGRPQAKQVAIAGANSRPSRDVLRRGLAEPAPSLDWRYLAASLLIAFLIVGMLLGRIALPIGLFYLLGGLASFALYSTDKAAAEAGQWRIPEVWLLGVDLAFGIIGALISQALIRHKTRKPSYVATTLLLAAVHAFWIVGLTFGWIDFADLRTVVGL